ncbi:pentapeptide repeat-containing protein [Microcoleus anatoxicus]
MIDANLNRANFRDADLRRAIMPDGTTNDA